MRNGAHRGLHVRPTHRLLGSARRRRTDDTKGQRCLLCCRSLDDVDAGDVRDMNHTYAVTEGGPDRCTEADTLLDAMETRLANAHSLNPGAHAWTCVVQHERELMMVDGKVRMLNYQGDNPYRCHELCYKCFVWGRDRANGTGSRANAGNLQVDQRNAFHFALDSFQTSGDAGGDQFMLCSDFEASMDAYLADANARSASDPDRRWMQPNARVWYTAPGAERALVTMLGACGDDATLAKVRVAHATAPAVEPERGQSRRQGDGGPPLLTGIGAGRAKAIPASRSL